MGHSAQEHREISAARIAARIRERGPLTARDALRIVARNARVMAGRMSDDGLQRPELFGSSRAERAAFRVAFRRELSRRIVGAAALAVASKGGA